MWLTLISSLTSHTPALPEVTSQHRDRSKPWHSRVWPERKRSKGQSQNLNSCHPVILYWLSFSQLRQYLQGYLRYLGHLWHNWTGTGYARNEFRILCMVSVCSTCTIFPAPQKLFLVICSLFLPQQPHGILTSTRGQMRRLRTILGNKPENTQRWTLNCQWIRKFFIKIDSHSHIFIEKYKLMKYMDQR